MVKSNPGFGTVKMGQRGAAPFRGSREFRFSAIWLISDRLQRIRRPTEKRKMATSGEIGVATSKGAASCSGETHSREIVDRVFQMLTGQTQSNGKSQHRAEHR
jgi:hypothetical protein